MGIQYTRKKESYDHQTTFEVEADMVLPGMTTERTMMQEQNSAVFETELPEAQEVGEPAERTGYGKSQPSWRQILLRALLLAALISVCIWIGTHK